MDWLDEKDRWTERLVRRLLIVMSCLRELELHMEHICIISVGIYLEFRIGVIMS